MLRRILCSFLSLLFSVLHLTNAPTPPETKPVVSGSFLQAWYCADWDAARWDAETAWMKEAGLDTLILQSLASFKNGEAESVYYVSDLPVFSGASAADVLSPALAACKKAGIKVFVGLADFDGWWDLAGLSPDYKKVCGVMTDMMREIYARYAADFGETLYGWYFPPEIDNIPQMKLSIALIADGLNGVLDTATSLDSGMPVLLSPYFSEKYAVPSVLATLPMWQTFFAKARFRDGDIFCPQDAVGAGWTSEKNLEKVWRMYRAAVDSCVSDVRLWANCECFTSTDAGNVPAPFDRFVRQLAAAAPYVEGFVAFSFNHFYSPFVSPEGYEAYLSYLHSAA